MRHGSFVLLIVAAAMCGAGITFGEPSSRTSTSAPSNDEVRRAIGQLDSPKVAEAIAAAEVVCKSDDPAAWQALRGVLVEPEKLGRLEIDADQGNFEGAPFYLRFRELARVLRIIAEGSDAHAATTLMWLVDQEPYAKTFTLDVPDRKPWRAYLAYWALQYIRNPSHELLLFCRRKLREATLDVSLRSRITEALAAYGTIESVGLFAEFRGEDIFLIMHRNRYECVRQLLNTYRRATNAEYAHLMLTRLFADSIDEPGRFRVEMKLPKIETKGDDAERLALMLRLFLKDHGKVALNDKEISRIGDLIHEIEQSTKPPDIHK